MKSRNAQLFLVILLLMAGASYLRSESSSGKYHLQKSYNVDVNGSKDFVWGHIALDSGARRLYIPSETTVKVVNVDSGKVVGEIGDTHGVIAVALAPELKRGFTTNPGDASVTVFNTETLATIKKVGVNKSSFILYDSFTKRIFPISTTTSVLDAASGDTAGAVKLDNQPAGAVSDGKGSVFVALPQKSEIAVIDARSLSVARSYPVHEGCIPWSLAYSSEASRLFVGCQNGLLTVLDSNTGETVTPISVLCSHVGDSVFDAEDKLLFESCVEGVVSVFKEIEPNYYTIVDTLKTEPASRIVAFDSKTKRIFLPAADFETAWLNGHPNKHQIKPETFRILVYAP
jgi:WD40 repeat protein